MTGISGWQFTSRHEARVAERRDQVAGRLPGQLDPQCLESARGALIARLPAGQVAKDIGAGLVAAIEGNPRWSTADVRRLATERGDGAALIAAYKKLGLELFRILSGTFALALIDDASEQIVIAIDRMGIRPMCYAFGQDSNCIFGSNTGSILSHGEMTDELSAQSIYEFVYFHVVPSPATIFTNIRKLEPGQFAVFSNGSWRADHYWKPLFTSNRDSNDAALEGQMMQELRSALARTAPDRHTGAFLSGGLDSSTVCGLANELCDEPLPAYSIGFSQEGYDEMAYARITAKHFGLHLREYYVTPDDIAEAMPIIASEYDEPFGNSSAVPAYFCARFAKSDGIQRLLAGDGGDELFAGNERYATQQLFDYYTRIPRILRTCILEPAAFNLPTDWSNLTRKLRRYIEQARVAMPERMQTYNFLHMNNPAAVFTPAFLRNVSTHEPIEKMESWYGRIQDADSLDRMLLLDWKLTLADNDIRKVNRMCSVAGIKVEYPMLDDDVVSYSTRIPTNLKLRNRELRYFFKKAVDGFLPKEVINKKKHGFGLPFGEWLKSSESLRAVVLPNVERLKARDIFRPEFVDSLLSKHQNEHAAYYGNILWVLVMFECWLQTHAAREP